MRLLICTQALDKRDSNLGFFHRWVEEFAKRCEFVTVICLREGEYSLPDNVRVYSLGKEEGTSRLTRIRRFFKYIRAFKDDYDAVFVHMNPEYLILGGYFWRKWGKKVSLWYTHKSVNARLRFALRFVNTIFTASKESFRIEDPRVLIMGHGIDTEAFKPAMKEASIETRIITIGRIAPSKHLIEMLGVLDELHARGERFRFTIVGAPITPVEEAYAKKLEQEIALRPYKEKIKFMGPLIPAELPALLNHQDVFLNFSTTGSMDKAVLEALSIGVPAITTNEAFADLLSPFELYGTDRDYKTLADRIDKIMNRSDRAAVVAMLRNKVVERHSLARLIPALISALQSR
jgi:glycosyltransferase involved in cell wall biosynthesis